MGMPRGNMANYFCCLRCRWNSGLNPGHVRLQDLPAVKLDTSCMGHEVVIVKAGRRICGQGAAFGNAPIVQNKAYFEIKVQSSGVWGLGVAMKNANVNVVPLGTDVYSWVLCHDGILRHNGEEKGRLSAPPQEGDVIGLTFDHVDMKFYVNGEDANAQITGFKNTVYPVVYVEDGAILDVFFSGFYHQPPAGFEEIMIEKSLL